MKELADLPSVSQDLLAAVEEVRPILAAGADEAESQGTLPAATVAALRDSGLLAMKVPAVLGGGEADILAQFDAIEALAYIDASAGWCVMVGASAIAWPAAFLPDQGVAQIFRDERIPTAAAVVQPAGKALKVAGGYRVSGQWSFASGVHHAEWIVAGALAPHPRGTGHTGLMVCCPRSDVNVVDDWRVAGLEGTGSSGVVIDDRFVPEELTWNFRHGQPRRGGAQYRLGWPGFVVHEPAALALGIAQRTLDVVMAREQSRNADAGARRVGLETMQREITVAQLRVRAARALAREVFRNAWDVVSSGAALPPRLQGEMRAAAAFATEASVEVAALAFRYGGSSVVYRSNVLQRCLRDVQVAAQHWLVRDTAYAMYGQFLLGVPNADPIADAR